MDSILDIELIKQFQKKREAEHYIYSLKMANNTSVTQTANIFDNKGGLSGTNSFRSYSQEEISSWIGDGADRMIGLMYDELNGQMVAVRDDFSQTNSYWYRINNTTNVATLIATVPYSGNADNTGGKCSFYNPVNGNFYLIYNDPVAGAARIMQRANNLVGVSGTNTFGTGTAGIVSVDVNTVSGEIYVCQGTGFWKINATTLVGTFVDLTGSGFSDPNHMTYVAATNELWFGGDDGTIDKLCVYNLNTSSASTYFDSAVGDYTVGQVVEIDGDVAGIVYRSGSYYFKKWDIKTKAEKVSKLINQTLLGVGTNAEIQVDSKDNIYVLTSGGYYVFSKDGQYLTFYRRADRTVTGGGTGTMFLGNNGALAERINGRFVPESGKLFISGATQTVFASTFNYVGGLSGLDLSTSGSSYSSSVTEFNTEPIMIYYISIFYKNGGSSLNNILKYIYESIFGACERRNFQPRSYVSAKNGDEQIIDIDLGDQPLVIDAAHYFQLDIPANEEVTLALYYKQAHKKDILRNKLIL